MSVTVQYHEVTDDHLGFTSARHNADGSVTIFYGDEPAPIQDPPPVEPVIQTAQPDGWWQRFLNFIRGRK